MVDDVMVEVEMQPAEPLRELVDKIVYVEFDIGPETPMPISPRPVPGLAISLPGATILKITGKNGRTVELPRASIVGPQTELNSRTSGSGRHIGLNIMFRPTGLFRLFNQSITEITDSWFPAEDVLGPDFLRFQEALQNEHGLAARKELVDRFLLSALESCRPPEAVAFATSSIANHRGPCDFAGIARSCGISERQLERQFLQQVGMTPKRFERLTRFRSALRMKAHAPSVKWTRVAQDAGYYDQNHLVKDFRKLTGTTPSTYLDAITTFMPGEMLDRS